MEVVVPPPDEPEGVTKPHQVMDFIVYLLVE